MKGSPMADLRTNFAGIESPNPFWLASGPPTNTYGQVAKAFDEGWGGAVWKTIGEPIINVFSPYRPVDLAPKPKQGLPKILLLPQPPLDRNPQKKPESQRHIIQQSGLPSPP